jgi:hypothetical protein
MKTGSCHCGAVRWDVELDDLGKVIACNCSMCQRSGSLLVFVPADKFHLRTSEDALQDYQFNKHVIHHAFCKTCGVKSFARGQRPDGQAVVAINVRCLEDLDDVRKLDVQWVDGRSR